MKVLILGGYGVFGSRLAALLVRDGHDVTLAGRSKDTGDAMARELGCKAVVLDRNGDLGPLADHEAVVDAAGPFHTYGGEDGADPYRLARAAIAAGTHYLDLSDNAAFCAGIAALDADARRAGVCAISGLSSVPAISSAAVLALAAGERPRVIDAAILPGNRAPRGLSVMQSILSQAGQPFPVWRGGRWGRATGWSAPARYTLPGGVTRQGWQIEVPDQSLFPAHFGAETVTFRAGLELGVMRYGLAGFALLRRALTFPVTRPVVRAFKAAADLLAPFGTGCGGMVVSVTTEKEVRNWRLLAEDGDGPYIPAVAARALLRRATLPTGAGPALSTVTLDEIEAAMSDLQVTTERVTRPVTHLFHSVLGAAFDSLPAEIRATHETLDTSRWSGRCTVTRGADLWARLLCGLFRFPPAQNETPVTVTKTVTRRGETWVRRFGRDRFRSHLSARDGVLNERFGPFSFTIGLTVRDAELQYPVIAGRLGPIPLPDWLMPISVAKEHATDGKFHFDVALHAPLTKELMVHYRGILAPAPPGDPDNPPG
ncbi:SDR family oxidoreductase [uncultured Maritimibacter sp.]|jgi:NAD(P)-dependent dehydrogenase (short-subunit alcohol dehydrogenase family)|uniref:SDR family oxidoreductase n=1 Tax=uncultured Maritimibacter sp. TaxID=991866 RepID=UPI000B333AE0|nr:SDR family oxidoreductase [uncultured Maritimibacter sp.]